MLSTSADCMQSRQAQASEPSHAIRNGLLCAFVSAACLWAAYPVAEMGFLDDWSYVKTAQVFAQTGHFVYNGWATAMLGWQVVWGALFIRLFGFSFTVVRLSTLVVAMATIALFHVTLVRFGINARNAVLGTLVLGLSPLFMPVAASFMTDVSGLFVIVLCLYLCQRAVAARSSEATIAWLCLAAASNVLGGTARQIAWLGALVMVPSAGWLLRKRRGVLWTSSLWWVISVVSVLACMRWFGRQPYSVPEPYLKGLDSYRLDPVFQVIRLLFQMLGAALCLMLAVFPILAAWLPQMRRLNRAALLRIAGITLAWGLIQWKAGWTMPWLPHLIFQEFPAVRKDIWLKLAPLILPTWGRGAISLTVVVATLVLIEQLRTELRPRVRTKVAPWDSDILWLLGPFSLSYFVLLMPRAYYVVVFDRYMLTMMPVAIICLLRLYQERIAATLPAISVIVLVIFGLLATASMHDWFAWYRARLVAIDEIRASGVPRTEIQGGAEYDGWTQIEDRGSIDGSLIFKDDWRAEFPECKFHFAPYTPAIHPKFTIVFPQKRCLAPSIYPPVTYRTWLPPYKSTIYVQEIPGSAD